MTIMGWFSWAASASPGLGLAGLANEEAIGVGIIDAKLALGHVFRIGNGGNFDSVMQKMISQRKKVG
jgi:hypothetical protein